MKIEEAIRLRQQNQPEEAAALLTEILQSTPHDPIANYQMAWTCDSMGKESEAVPYYGAALANGLMGEDRKGAMLGLGSTYRCLGEYEKSLIVFNEAVREFADDRSLKTFRALTLQNLGRSEDSIAELLILLLDTTTDASIKKYDQALRFYSDKLSETWK